MINLRLSKSSGGKAERRVWSKVPTRSFLILEIRKLLYNPLQDQLRVCSRNVEKQLDPLSRFDKDGLVTDRFTPTQPPTLNGTGNEYRPKGGDALRLGSKAGWFILHVDKRVGGR